MADENKTRLRDEVATLSETVRELRDEVARLRAAQPSGPGCVHICGGTHPAWQPAWWPGTQIWCDAGAAIGDTVLNIPGHVATTTTCVQPAGYTSTYTVSN